MFDVPDFVGQGNAGNEWDYDAWPMVVAALEAANAGALQGFKNRLINGGFAINQRQAASNADDTYCFDRWYALTESGAIAASQLTSPEAASPYGIRLTQSQASAQRMGLAQIIESSQCRDLRALPGILSGRVRRSDGGDVRYAILEWTGTADAVTSDVVNNWSSTTYTAGNFFNSTTLSVLAVGEVATTAAAWFQLDPISASLGASANNIIVVVWCEGQMAQNATLDLARMQFEPGDQATVFEARPDGLERALCQRFFQKSYNHAEAPGAVSTVGAHTMTAHANTSYLGMGFRAFPVAMRGTPTITLYNPSTGSTSNPIRNTSAAANVPASTVAIGEAGFGVLVDNTAVAVADTCLVHFTASAEL